VSDILYDFLPYQLLTVVYPLLLFLPRLRLTSAHGKMREVVKASGHQRARKDWELTAAAEIWLQMLLEIGS